MRYLPVGLDVRGRTCLVVGGGKVGTRKVRSLLGAGASVTLVAPQATRELARLADSGAVRWIREPFRDDHLRGVFLVVAATDDDDLNTRLAGVARELGALVCDASSAERSQVIFGALHRGEEFTVAVFTDGRDPSRAREVRDRIAAVEGDWGGGGGSGGCRSMGSAGARWSVGEPAEERYHRRTAARLTGAGHQRTRHAHPHGPR
jgi:precorrin-2 dehydrogenase / sirohydrochlorin ferrochelatase